MFSSRIGTDRRDGNDEKGKKSRKNSQTYCSDPAHINCRRMESKALDKRSMVVRPVGHPTLHQLSSRSCSADLRKPERIPLALHDLIGTAAFSSPLICWQLARNRPVPAALVVDGVFFGCPLPASPPDGFLEPGFRTDYESSHAPRVPTLSLLFPAILIANLGLAWNFSFTRAYRRLLAEDGTGLK